MGDQPGRLSWQGFEDLVARIQQDMVPMAKVERNVKVMGQSGKKRQLDVTIRYRLGVYPGLIVVECKQYRRSVTIDKVEAFHTKRRDVGASDAIMVSTCGFTDGAVATARLRGIRLQTLQEAVQQDWRKLVVEPLVVRLRSERVAKVVVEFEEPIQNPSSDELIVFSNSTPVCKVNDLHRYLPQPYDPEERIGQFRAVFTPDSKLAVRIGSTEIPVSRVIVDAVGVGTEYIIPLSIAEGYVVKDVLNGSIQHEEFATEPWDWMDLLRTQEGRELTPEEWEQRPSSTFQPIPVAFVTSSPQRWKLVVKTTHAP